MGHRGSFAEQVALGRFAFNPRCSYESTRCTDTRQSHRYQFVIKFKPVQISKTCSRLAVPWYIDFILIEKSLCVAGDTADFGASFGVRFCHGSKIRSVVARSRDSEEGLQWVEKSNC